MITLQKNGNAIQFVFDDNSGYLQNGTIDVPVNSLTLVMDSSDMATFKKSATNDIFVSALYSDFGMSRSELESWYKENMVGSTGGGGGVTPEEVEEMIDESISGKVSTTTFTAYTANTQSVLSGAVTDVKVLTVSQQNEVQLAKYTGGSTAHTYAGTIYKIGSGLTWDYNTKIISTDNTTIATKDDVASATSGKVDTTTFETYSGNVETALGGKQATLVAGRGISITTGETADTVSFNLPISAGTGTNSIVEGIGTTASGNYSHAEGDGTEARGNNSHAEGYGTIASGNSSHAEGNITYAKGDYSHAEGIRTTANGNYSHAEGGFTTTKNQSEHASGQYNNSVSASTTFGDSGNTLFSVGNGTGANARHNAFEIRQNGDIYLSLNGQDVKLQDQLGGKASQSDLEAVSGAVGTKQDQLISGTNIKTINNTSLLGSGNIDIQGGSTYTAGRGIDITNDTISVSLPISAGTGTNSIAEGVVTQANGEASHAEGAGAQANGQISHAEGNQTVAGGQYSHTEGYQTKANNNSEHASGQFNVSNSASTTFGDSGNTLFSVGNGTTRYSRHNAFEIRQNGDIYLTKDGQDVKLQDQLGGSSITVDTALDSGSTNPVENRVIYNKIDEVEQVTAAALNNINDALGGLKLVKLTQAQYDALSPNYDANTLYIILG